MFWKNWYLFVVDQFLFGWLQILTACVERTRNSIFNFYFILSNRNAIQQKKKKKTGGFTLIEHSRTNCGNFWENSLKMLPAQSRFWAQKKKADCAVRPPEMVERVGEIFLWSITKLTRRENMKTQISPMTVWRAVSKRLKMTPSKLKDKNTCNSASISKRNLKKKKKKCLWRCCTF